MTTAEVKLKKLASTESSKWVEKAEWRVANESMLEKSAKIALTILRTIREKGISQKQLAEMLNTSPQHVNKLLKGNENFTLETITKIGIALGITLIEIPDWQVSIKVEQNKSAVKRSKQKVELPAQTKSYKEMMESTVSFAINEDNEFRLVA